MPSPTILEFTDRARWAKWLGKNYSTAADGVWLRLAKKGSDGKSVTYPEALDVALCYGWIDGQKRGESDHTWLQRFVPRTKRSIWSKVNRQKVQALIESGAMQPAGLAEIERARADGRWDAAYDSPKMAAVPADLQAALDANPRAKAFFAQLNAQNRYAVLHRVEIAKKPETRERKIRQFVEMLARGETLHPQAK